MVFSLEKNYTRATEERRQYYARQSTVTRAYFTIGRMPSGLADARQIIGRLSAVVPAVDSGGTRLEPASQHCKVSRFAVSVGQSLREDGHSSTKDQTCTTETVVPPSFPSLLGRIHHLGNC